jgi:ferredoxin
MVVEGGGHETGRFTVRVDHDAYVGNATCRAAAPKLFVAVSSGQTVVADPEAERLETGLETAAKVVRSARFLARTLRRTRAIAF